MPSVVAVAVASSSLSPAAGLVVRARRPVRYAIRAIRAIRAGPCGPCESVRVRASPVRVRASPCESACESPCVPCGPVQSVQVCEHFQLN